MFAGFDLFASRNAIAVPSLGGVSLSASIFLIEELNHPPEGFIKGFRWRGRSASREVAVMVGRGCTLRRLP